MRKRVLSVGHCAPDHRAIAALIQSHFDAEVVRVEDLARTLEQLRGEHFDLVLVNRILDLDGDEGLEVIRQIQADTALRTTPVMMITNFPQYQEQAQQAGAVPGFGKQSLHAPETVAMLQRWLT